MALHAAESLWRVPLHPTRYRPMPLHGEDRKV
jgi:hypothetical protein